MKICTVIGARPQFIKASALSALIEKDPGLTEVLIHTGQHSDSNLSAVFFEELGIPEPEYNLGLTGLSHAVMTGRMMEQMENILVREKPDAVVLYGDTNSTLAGALAASKLHIPVAHIEAGLRSYNRAMPEELNRIITDRLSQFLFTPSENASANLGKEGMGDEATIRNVGDIMYDVFLNLKVSKDKAMRLPEPFPRKGENFGLLTLHRQENTDNPKVLTEIIRALNDVNNHSLPLICPMHPRTLKQIRKFDEVPDFRIIEPLGYFQMIQALTDCSLLITDSGGMQKEAYYAGKYCITLREETEWTELLDEGVNVLAGHSRDSILDSVDAFLKASPFAVKNIYGDGQAAHKILETLKNGILERSA